MENEIICETDKYRIVRKDKGCVLYVADGAGGFGMGIHCGNKAAALKYYKSEFDMDGQEPELAEV